MSMRSYATYNFLAAILKVTSLEALIGLLASSRLGKADRNPAAEFDFGFNRSAVSSDIPKPILVIETRSVILTIYAKPIWDPTIVAETILWAFYKVFRLLIRGGLPCPTLNPRRFIITLSG